MRDGLFEGDSGNDEEVRTSVRASEFRTENCGLGEIRIIWALIGQAFTIGYLRVRAWRFFWFNGEQSLAGYLTTMIAEVWTASHDKEGSFREQHNLWFV